MVWEHAKTRSPAHEICIPAFTLSEFKVEKTYVAERRETNTRERILKRL